MDLPFDFIYPSPNDPPGLNAFRKAASSKAHFKASKEWVDLSSEEKERYRKDEAMYNQAIRPYVINETEETRKEMDNPTGYKSFLAQRGYVAEKAAEKEWERLEADKKKEWAKREKMEKDGARSAEFDEY